MPSMSIKVQNIRLLSSLLHPQSARQVPIESPAALKTFRVRPRPQHSYRNCSRVAYSTTIVNPQAIEPTPSTQSSSSVSPTETAHFSRLASTWWDPHGPSRLLHAMNPLRHDVLQDCLSSSQPRPQTLRILDVGTGAGIFAESAARLPEVDKVIAIDPTRELIEAAKEHMRGDPILHAGGKLEYRCCSVEDLAAQENQKMDEALDSKTESTSSTTAVEKPNFKVVSVFEVLEHISDPAAFLRHLSDRLTPGGWLIGSTISRSVISYVTTKLVAEAPLVGLVPPGTHNWNQYIKPEELQHWLWKQGVWDDGDMIIRGCIYVPGFGWKWVNGSESLGNYFFGVRRKLQEQGD